MVGCQLATVDTVNQHCQQQNTDKHTDGEGFNGAGGLAPIPQDKEQTGEEAGNRSKEKQNKEQFEHGSLPGKAISGAITLSKDQSRRRFKWMLLGMGLLLLPLLIMLGFWQLERAEEKQQLLAQWETGKQSVLKLSDPGVIRFSKITAAGQFDPQRWWLLDNRTRQGRVGYEVIGLFYPDYQAWAVLVNLGWVPADVDRSIYPQVKLPQGAVTISGYATEPSQPLMLDKTSWDRRWPQRLQRLDFAELQHQTGLELSPWVIRQSNPLLSDADLSWTPAVMPAEKHQAYALQWFAMAVALAALIGWSLRALRNEDVGV